METVNQGNQTGAQGAAAQSTGAQPAAGAAKTFTQAELDAIISERLNRSQAKYADYETLKEKAEKYDQAEAANKTELQKATDRANDLQKQLDALKQAEKVAGIRQQVSTETGVPVNLLTADTEEACKAQAEAIKAYANPGYPKVKDGGEPQNHGKATTRQQFADWLNALN